MAELDKKEHKNWVVVGCALNIAKNGITPKIQTEMETWYQSLVSSPPLQSLAPCTCIPRVPKCVTCVTWESELKRHHTSSRPKICWDNSDRKQWGSRTGGWEVAKVFMPTLGSRKAHVINAETTDIGGLLNLLEWCPFIKPSISRKVLSSARDECRNHWAHAPKQELQDTDVSTIFGHLKNLLNDPVFSTDKAAQKASEDLQDLFRDGLVNVRVSEVEALHLLRQSLVADLIKCQDDLADVLDKVGQIDVETKKVSSGFQKDLSEVKEQSGLNREEIENLRQQLERKLRDVETSVSSDISAVLRAADDFNRRLDERDDLREAFEFIREDVENVRNGMQHVVMELNSTTSQVAKLEIDLANVNCEVKEVANEVASNKSTISGLQRDVKDVKEDVETLKWNCSKEIKDDGDIQCTAPCRLKAFTGRTSALEWLEKNIVLESRENGPGTSCNTKTICGLGGCGKTSLTVEFSWRYANCFPGGVFWINGESDENIRKSVVEILALVNIDSSTENIDDTLNRFLAWLSKKKLPWLLVVDNADELQDSRCPVGIKKICRGPWQRNGSAIKNGHILFTTRQNAKDTREFLKLSCDDCFELKCFREEEGALFLMQKTADFEEESPNQEATLLAKELGALPLALEQAAAYISASPIPLSFKDYLDKYRAVKVRLLEQQPATPLSVEAQYRLSVHTTWEMNFEFIKKRSPAAASMMRIAAFLESENIPIEVINPGFLEGDQEELKESPRSKIDIAAILGVLSSYSLFSVDHQTKVFSVHKLVQEVIRDSLTTSERVEALVAATRVLNSALQETKKSVAARGHKWEKRSPGENGHTIFTALVLNFHTLKKNIEDEIDASGENSAHILYNNDIIQLCQSVVDFTSNIVFFNRLTAELCDFQLQVVRMSGIPDVNVLLEVMVNIASKKRNCLGSANYKEAKKLSQETVKKLNELEKSDAIIKDNIKYLVLTHRASYYAWESQWKKNYDALLELQHLPMSDAEFVDLQIRIARAENNVSTGNFQRVLRRINKALECARRIYPLDHPALLRVLQFITVHFRNANKLEKAREYANEVLNIAKKYSPVSHYYITAIMNALSVLCSVDPHSAEDTLLGVLKDRWPQLYELCRGGVVGKDMDTCLDSVNDASFDHAVMVLEGLMYCFVIMANSRDQTKTKLPKQNGNVYLSIAEVLLLFLKKIFCEENHPEVERAYSYLLEVHKFLGNKEEAYKLSERITQSKQPVTNQYFPRSRALFLRTALLAMIYRATANRYFESGDYSRALESYNEALNVCSNDAKLLTNRAKAYVKLSEQQRIQEDEQQKLLKAAVQDSEKAITADPTWVKGYYWKAVCLAKLGERGPSLAAASVAEHLFPLQCTQIPAVVDHFGRYDARVVSTVENLLHATERTDNNLVILVKGGRYGLPKPLKPPTNAVMVGLGNVQITCTKDVPLQLDETVYIENITLSRTMESITKLKEKATEFRKSGQLDMALVLYSQALTTCPSDARLLTARAITCLEFAKQKKSVHSKRKSLLELALKDSEAAITADSNWLLGYYNKAVSLAELDRKLQALAASAVFKHLSSGRDIPEVTHRYGGLQIHIVQHSDNLSCVLQCLKQREGVNQVVLIKEGDYLLEKTVEITQPIVVVGQGKVTVSCKTGRPFHFTQEHYVENVELV